MPLPHKTSDLIPELGLIPHPEGGFFVETHRSGSIPMSSKGQTDLNVPDPTNGDLIVEANVVASSDNKLRRGLNRPDGDERRNALTSIYWVPTIQSPILMLATNCSDHVHYYQGGLSFMYYLLDPNADQPRLERVVLGPNLERGEKLQVCVRGGMWKCGEIILPGGDEDEDGQQLGYEYSIIGEAVAPGFDFHDFAWITEEKIQEVVCSSSAEREKVAEIKKTLMKFVHRAAAKLEVEGKTVDDASDFYEKVKQQEDRTNERS
mmetsp:Transcript_30662/g.45384  ORF Transcript_30662/g.45384 Transcript_30662/m.45384 type:complete len:263 (+) Transcript_30662:40-828(+)|eukprot:CAMPEP_0195530864 /NCGR_PEP_ID=MMETSP0794_2-20130614/33959_1 /TAXON_ID=515487 /ORGANISM="Stephanopyxis turris, Strain CCMP 815" /LENGTH=262 /DNA_ID=CAMNT_0040662473 /DNA_START=42 /DNA_END=830 /DNA_ORIENTATION=-